MEGADYLTEKSIVPVAQTLVLFGRVGNGKSAVGNSIFGKKEFVSRISACGVTTQCRMEKTTLDDGQVVNVIDTPGLFDLSRGSDTPEYLADEMVKCIILAKDGIHGFILVCSIKTRFTVEEETVIQSLGKIFGEKIFDYMVVVFTGGDELSGMNFPEFLSTCPSSLKKVLQICKKRVVLFDNRTKDETQRKDQVQQLMSHIKTIITENGQPYITDVVRMMNKSVTLGKQEAEHGSKRKQVPTDGADTRLEHGAKPDQGPTDVGSSNNPKKLWGKSHSVQSFLRELKRFSRPANGKEIKEKNLNGKMQN
ncbi:immune-associated nucleotide-binding protein 9-like isoform X1 [Papaver somniferum]|uniref:immune-associated nucleotide-binding protein 9-like isoform X1 n=1 Tax=Papaver somniferum TaxID=3469 RepID=UPI000E6F5D50|nr:immune-associated nucleotide-binding protein 9-like isoform X1 [Papaver somniferum]